MEKPKTIKSNNKRDLNGNNSTLRKTTKKKKNGISAMIKDHIVSGDGQVFYPCRFCNKVFPVKKARTTHIRKCPAKDYILSVDGDSKADHSVPTLQTNHKPTEQPPVKHNIPTAKKSPIKIDIKQNIILDKQLDVEEILTKSKSPPIKLTIRRSPSNGTVVSNHFTVSNSLILKEKNESNDEFSTIAKRLETNSVTIIKQPKKIEEPDLEPESEEASETTCRECTTEFRSPLELLRHSRKCHSYPKVMMALSEVKKFYVVKDRSECPICHKPLKTNFRSAFIKHLHTHTNEMKYSCNVCNKKFRRSDHMKAHEKRHIVKDKKGINVKLD